MKVKALRSGLHAHPNVKIPHMRLKEGKEYECDELIGSVMCKDGWAEKVSIAKKVVDTVVKKTKKIKKGKS